MRGLIACGCGCSGGSVYHCVSPNKLCRHSRCLTCKPQRSIPVGTFFYTQGTQYRYHALFNGSQFFWSGCLAGAICHKPPGYVGAHTVCAPTYPGGLWHMVSVGQPDQTNCVRWATAGAPRGRGAPAVAQRTHLTGTNGILRLCIHLVSILFTHHDL